LHAAGDPCPSRPSRRGRRRALCSALACALAGLPSLLPAADATVTVEDAAVIVDGPGTFQLPFLVTRAGATGDGVRIVVETAQGGANPGIPGTDYVALPPGTERLLPPGETETTVEVEVLGSVTPGPDKTLLLRLTGVHAFDPQPRLAPAASRFPVLGSFPSSLAVADLDADGHLDLVTGNDLSLDASVLLADGDGGFAEPVRYPMTVAPTLFKVIVAVGDVTGDGAPDIVATGFAADALQLFSGDGSGGFAEPVTVPLGHADTPTALALADVNGDRDLDVVTAIGAGQHVLVSIGTGGGGFAPAQSFPTGAGPEAVAITDVTGDGHPDILTANGNGAGNDVSVLAGDGTGGFAAPQHLSIGAAAPPHSLVVADVTGNGHADIVTANGDPFSGAPGSVSVLEGDGAGGFAAPIQLPLSEGDGVARGVAAADVTGNGQADVVVTLPQSNAVALLAGEGGGGFAPPVRIPTPFGPNAVVIADVTGDRNPDVVTANAVAGSVSILPGDGAGEVGFPGRFDAGRFPHGVVALDLDDSGHADVVTANAQSNDVSVLLNDGAGGFADAVEHAVGASPTGITAGDVNDDSIPDLVSANAASGDVSVLLGDGAGGFAAALQYSVGEGFHSPYAVAVGDVNGDGHLDIATANTNIQNESLSVLLGDGDGGFADPVMLPVGSGSFHEPRSITLADATGDGHLDIVTANLGSSDLSLLTGDGTGTFAPAVHPTAGDGPVVAAVAEVTGDEHPDLLALNHTAQTVSILAGDGAGGFAPAVHFPIFDLPDACLGEGVCPWAWGMVAADVTGDGHLDIVTANTDNDTVSVLPNDGAGSFPTVTSFDTGAHPGSLAVADLTGDGNLDIVTANRENNDVAVLPNELSHVELLDDEALGTIIYDPPLFADDFESGDTSAWSVVVE
jgi:hypothetical protein